MIDAVLEALPRLAEPRGESMRAPDGVSTVRSGAPHRLKALGWGVRRIAAELGCSHMTVRRHLEADGWLGYRTPQRAKALDGLEAWLAERLCRHRGNADVVRQGLGREHGIRVSLRAVERAVQELRRELVAEARAIDGRRFASPRGPSSRLPSLRDRIGGFAVDGPSSRRIPRDGRARSPIGAFTAPPARRRSSGSAATRRVP